MDADQPQKPKCHGMCLQQTGNINHYYRLKECEENCQPIKCPNFKLCGTAAPQCILWCNGGRCANCDMTFGCDLTFTEKEVAEECVVCLEDKTTFVRWECQHDLCLECFRKNHGWRSDFMAPILLIEPKVYTDKEYAVAKIEMERIEAEDAKRVVVLDENGWEVESPEPERPEYIGKCPICRNEGIPNWDRKRREKEGK